MVFTWWQNLKRREKEKIDGILIVHKQEFLFNTAKARFDF